MTSFAEHQNENLPAPAIQLPAPAPAAKPATVWKPTRTAPVMEQIPDYWDDRSVWRLIEMLRTKRPTQTVGILDFVARYLSFAEMQEDSFGNVSIVIGDKPNVLWSCHLDTVHGYAGHQNIVVEDDWVVLAEDSPSGCLGADDTAGIWLMTEMMRAGVPGLYIFHEGEEVGRVGSQAIASKTPDLLEGIDFAIAFDRRGFRDVITHQLSQRCCSEAFAKSLCDQLPAGYRPDSTGSYTDTKSYIDIVPECTNVSVGYISEHTRNEALYLPHIVALRDALILIDVSKLKVERDPKVREMEDNWGDYGGFYGSSWRGRGNTRQSYGYTGSEIDWPSSKGKSAFLDRDDAIDAYGFNIPKDMLDLCTQYPEELAEWLDAQGVSVEELWDQVSQALAS